MIKVEEIVEKYKGYEVDEEKLKEFLIPPKPKTVYELEKGDRYYYIDTFGNACCDTWANDEIDNGRRAIGDCFLTKEEAEFEVERRKVEAILLKYGSRDFEYSKNNNYMYYGHGESSIEIGYYRSCQNQGGIFFDTEELCQKAIEEAGEDNIKKYIFGVVN